MNTVPLNEFQDFLIKNKLSGAKQAPFFAGWVSRFIAFSNHNRNISLDDRIRLFLDNLGKDTKAADWQIRQAASAITLYLHHFRKDDLTGFSDTPEKNAAHQNRDALLRRMRESMLLRHYSPRTLETYLGWSRRFLDYVAETRGSAAPESGDARNYLSHLALERHVSASTQNQAFNAILFLFREILHINLEGMSQTVRAKRGLRLPVVLSPDEVRQVFEKAEPHFLLMLQLLYGAGLRISELVRLRVKDVDFDAGLVLVRSGKGDKDRATLLPAALRDALRAHLERVRALHEEDVRKGCGKAPLPDALARKYPNAEKEWAWQFVFPSQTLSVEPATGTVRRWHTAESTVQKAMRTAVGRAGISKPATVHTLRHSFATHLLMSGTNIRKIQDLLGHKNVETTMIYTHVAKEMAPEARSPLDTMLNTLSQG